MFGAHFILLKWSPNIVFLRGKGIAAKAKLGCLAFCGFALVGAVPTNKVVQPELRPGNVLPNYYRDDLIGAGGVQPLNFENAACLLDGVIARYRVIDARNQQQMGLLGREFRATRDGNRVLIGADCGKDDMPDFGLYKSGTLERGTRQSLKFGVGPERVSPEIVEFRSDPDGGGATDILDRTNEIKASTVPLPRKSTDQIDLEREPGPIHRKKGVLSCIGLISGGLEGEEREDESYAGYKRAREREAHRHNPMLLFLLFALTTFSGFALALYDLNRENTRLIIFALGVTAALFGGMGAAAAIAHAFD